jgi:CheY-like chemotaxis protein
MSCRLESNDHVFDEPRRLRQDVHVVLCTAYSRETAFGDFRERKIQGFIRKPHRIDDLVKVLDE